MTRQGRAILNIAEVFAAAGAFLLGSTFGVLGAFGKVGIAEKATRLQFVASAVDDDECCTKSFAVQADRFNVDYEV